ncbi:hypothetical protein P8452_73069 [Trifolium repens]|nr:hypothetical protein P8452_73069 [Trifolium repens]
MGLGVFGSVLVLTFLFKHLASQQPNTDEFYVSDFLKKMGLTSSSKVYNFSSSVCSWKGVTCDSNKEHVFQLNFSGSLTNNIGNFGLLENFDLSKNNFSDEIPEALSSLVNLKVLKLDHNMFVKSIPSGILKCESLVSIDLSSNQLSGTLPHGFGDAFPKLRTMNLAENNIDGGVSDFQG